ncbi:MAG: 3'-5' exonuclease [Saprospiraceae bacterium]|nr:3'-5' exonuclease [Candidatus Vicinibacter affinis]MBK7799800.1 3'-5' exonuclease [Candidatus Vicinibacter affinis]MBK8404061.1 3'-5' exonuclease [Candidatus Vicinibacter affinis]
MDTRKILFLDIETVSSVSSFDQLSPEWRDLWVSKSRYYLTSEPLKSPAEIYSEKAAIFSEFGRIVCISIGFFKDEVFRIKSFFGNDEKVILSQFFDLVLNHYNNPNLSGFCGHNIKEFDIPYICRRAIINGLTLPAIFQLNNKKPWEIQHIVDTMEMWKFGDYKHFTSLDLLASCLQLPSSKSDISGKDVGRVYWEEKDLPRISEYCMKDVILTARVYLKLKSGNNLLDNSILYIKD